MDVFFSLAFHFLATQEFNQKLFVVVGGNVTINCKTNEERVSSTLWVRKNLNPAQMVIPNDSTIVQRGNIFYFSHITVDDAGVYVCKASFSRIQKTIEEEITSLLVFTGNYLLKQ